MRIRGLVLLTAAALLVTGCAGDDGEPDTSLADGAASGATSGAGGGAATGGGGSEGRSDAESSASELPRAGSFEEVAALLKPALGACERMDTTGNAVELTRADQVRGGKQKVLCWYGGQQFTVAILLLDADNATMEAFHKDRDIASSERVGMGFTITLVGNAGPQAKTAAEHKLAATKLPYLNCEKDFAPHDGVTTIEAKTPGCRYTPTPRI